MSEELTTWEERQQPKPGHYSCSVKMAGEEWMCICTYPEPVPVPEAGAGLMLLAGLVLLAALGWRRKRSLRGQCERCGEELVFCGSGGHCPEHGPTS
jgi:hypothetical protein